MGPVVFVGPCLLEHVFDVPRLGAGNDKDKGRASSYRPCVGGLAGSAAMAAHRLRHPSASPRVRLVSSVGNDETGAALLRVLHREGLSRQGVCIVAGARSGVAAVLLSPLGERQVHVLPGQGLEPAGPLDESLWRDAAAVQVDAQWPEVARTLLEGCRQRGLPTLLNADSGDTDALQSLAPLADWVLFSVEGLRAWASERHAIWQTLAKQAARQLPRSHLVVELGSEGVWWHAPGGRVLSLSATWPMPHDRNGAADALRGALALGLGEGRSAQFALRWALAASALASGGQPLSRAAALAVIESAA